MNRNDRRSDAPGSRRLRNLWQWVTIAGLLAFSAFAWWYASRASGNTMEILCSRFEPLAIAGHMSGFVAQGAPCRAAGMRME